MAKAIDRADIFEKIPVRRAVLMQIFPAVASQMIVLIYNLADTYFVGRLNDPVETAAITVAYPVFLMLTAISNLFGVGGASAVARALGRKETQQAKQISSLSFWGGIALSVVFSVLFFFIARPVLTLCGADENTFDAAYGYAKWVVILGGPFTVMNTLLANLVRSEGSAGKASVGVSLGGVLNIMLDPLFVLPRFLGFGAVGAGIATAISNAAAALYLLRCVLSQEDTVLSVELRQLVCWRKHIGTILAVGFPSALQYALTVVAVAAQAKFVSAYPTEAVAGLGIVKKLDQLPLYFSIGVSNGLLPLLAYNHAAGNISRRKGAFRFGAAVSFAFSVLCLVAYELFAPHLVGLFIADGKTVAYGADFLRLMVTAMPAMSICYPMIIQFQAMGKAKESLVCSVLRKGVLDLPLLFLMDRLLPLYGCMLVQPIVDAVSLAAASVLYFRIRNAEERT